MLTISTLVQRFGLYCVVGFCAFVTDYSVFLAALTAGTGPYVANVIGISAGVTVSFSLNRKYNFRKEDEPVRRAARFLTVALGGMILSTLLIMLLLAHGVDVRLAKAASMIVVFGVQFTANLLWTFR